MSSGGDERTHTGHEDDFPVQGPERLSEVPPTEVEGKTEQTLCYITHPSVPWGGCVCLHGRRKPANLKRWAWVISAMLNAPALSA